MATNMSDQQVDFDDLMMNAIKQLEDHKVWLSQRIRDIPADVGMTADREMLVAQVAQMRVRSVTVSNGRIATVNDIPDELHAFLRSPACPDDVKAALVGWHDVSVDSPSYTVKRTT